VLFRSGFEEISQIKSDNHEIKDLQLRGTVFEVRIAGESATGFEFKGITFPDINSTLDY